MLAHCSIRATPDREAKIASRTLLHSLPSEVMPAIPVTTTRRFTVLASGSLRAGRRLASVCSPEVEEVEPLVGNLGAKVFQARCVLGDLSADLILLDRALRGGLRGEQFGDDAVAAGTGAQAQNQD